MRNLSVGIYIHIPFCLKKCNYCDFPSYPGMEDYWAPYVSAVEKELALKSGEFRDASIGSIFIGGGTPSVISGHDIARILNTVYREYRVSEKCETTIESNPGTLSSQKLKIYLDSGVNRLSMGLQACQDNLLKKLGRIHSSKDFFAAIKLAQKHGFDNINADIIFGIPDQIFMDWQDTVNGVISAGLTHISCYSLIIEEGTVFGRLKDKGLLREIDEELDRRMYHYAVDCLNNSGFYQYEISNFAKPGYQCRHNMNYWERGEYIGIGAGAHSFSENRRYANTYSVEDYINSINRGELLLAEDCCLSEAQGLSEKIILGLRLNKGIDLQALSSEYGIDAERKYHTEFERLLSLNLVESTGGVIRLTKKGMDLANQVFIEFI